MANLPHEADHDPHIAAKLAARYDHLRSVTGPEPADLGRVARWVDGLASPEEAKAIEARVAGDAELGEVVARVRASEQVASLDAARAKRDALRNRVAWAGGAVLAAAAIALIAISSGGRPPVGDGPLGAGPLGSRPTVTIAADHTIVAHGASALFALSPGSARVVASGEVAMQGPCAFVLAVAGNVDPARAADALRDAVSPSCELPPLDVLKAHIEGATALTLTRL